MRKNIRILLCSLILGLGVTGCLIIPGATQKDTVFKEQETGRAVAWWSTMYERPNPDRLPVQVRFQWLKGLE